MSGPEGLTAPERDVLRRVERRKPLNMNDRDAVLALIAAGLMHVTPELDRKDPCPYRLTEPGEAALRGQP